MKNQTPLVALAVVIGLAFGCAQAMAEKKSTKPPKAGSSTRTTEISCAWKQCLDACKAAFEPGEGVIGGADARGRCEANCDLHYIGSNCQNQ